VVQTLKTGFKKQTHKSATGSFKPFDQNQLLNAQAGNLKIPA